MSEDLQNGGWFWSENRIIDEYGPKLGAIGVAVYAYLCRHANSKGECFPSLAHLCKTLGISEPCARKYLRLIAGLKLLNITPRKDPKGDAATNLYTLNRNKGVVNVVTHPPIGVGNVVSQGGQRGLPPVGNDVSPNKTKYEQDLENKRVEAETEVAAPVEAGPLPLWQQDHLKATGAIPATAAPNPPQRPPVPLEASNRRCEPNPRDELQRQDDLRQQVRSLWRELLPALFDLYGRTPTGRLKDELQEDFEARLKLGQHITPAQVAAAAALSETKHGWKRRNEQPVHASALLNFLATAINAEKKAAEPAPEVSEFHRQYEEEKRRGVALMRQRNAALYAALRPGGLPA